MKEVKHTLEKFKPLKVVSFPTKGVRRIRINGFTLSRIDSEVFKDEEYTLYRSGLKQIELDVNRQEVLNFLDLEIMLGYTDILYIDTNMCAFAWEQHMA